MKWFLLLLFLGLAQAATVTITWVAPTTNVDGSAITGALTYDILQGVSGGPYTQIDSGVTTPGVKETIDPTKGACIVMMAVEAGVTSPYSVPACLAEQPNAPTAIAVN